MLLAVFNLKLHLTYPISADNMGATICAPRHCHPVYTAHRPLSLLPRPLTFTNTFQILSLSWHPSAIALCPLSSPFSPPYFPLKTPEVSGTSLTRLSSAWKTDTSVSEEDEQLIRRVITECMSSSGQSFSLLGYYRPCRYA